MFLSHSSLQFRHGPDKATKLNESHDVHVLQDLRCMMLYVPVCRLLTLERICSGFGRSEPKKASHVVVTALS